MKYVPDRTGRFRERPHYQPAELDAECEKIIIDFMNERCGGFSLPIPTDVLTKLIERDTEYLDLYADLSQEEGFNVEGVTDFCPGKKPCVKISLLLSGQERQSNRLRTTLAHEYGHVKFHDPLYQLDEPTLMLFPDAFNRKPLRCNRDDMLLSPFTDWMEWQAGYTCGAILMPISHVKRLVAEYITENRLFSPLNARSPYALTLISKVATTFDVSEQAARIRLLKLACLIEGEVSQSFLN